MVTESYAILKKNWDRGVKGWNGEWRNFNLLHLAKWDISSMREYFLELGQPV